MGVRMRKVHMYICVTLWSAWAVGILLLIVHLLLLFLRDGVPHEIFFSVVHPYNMLVMLCSLLPVEPVALIAALIQDIHSDGITKNVGKSILYFVITVVIWFLYIGLYISLTGI